MTRWALIAVVMVAIANTWPGGAQTALAAGVSQPLLRTGDVPRAYKKLEFKTYRHYATTFVLPNGQSCGGTKTLPFPPTAWVLGSIESLLRVDSSGFLVCALTVTTATAAARLDQVNRAMIAGDIRKGQLHTLPTGKIGDAAVGGAGSSKRSVMDLVVVRSGTTEVVVAYFADVHGGPALSAATVLSTVRLIVSRVP
jgi:hypothetical protein